LNNDESDPAGIRTEILDSLKKLPLFDDTSEFEAFICDLGKLEMVEYKDLKDWFGKYYGNAKQVEDVARIVFGEDQRNRTMAEVEEKLHPLVESYLNRENRI